MSKSCQKVVKKLSKSRQKLSKVVKKLSKSCHKKLSPSSKHGKFERRSDQESNFPNPQNSKTRKLEWSCQKEETTKNGMKNEELDMKKLGIRRLDATSSHLVKMQK
jgi:hypothetical protein